MQHQIPLSPRIFSPHVSPVTRNSWQETPRNGQRSRDEVEMHQISTAYKANMVSSSSCPNLINLGGDVRLTISGNQEQDELLIFRRREQFRELLRSVIFDDRFPVCVAPVLSAFFLMYLFTTHSMPASIAEIPEWASENSSDAVFMSFIAMMYCIVMVASLVRPFRNALEDN